MQPQPKQTDSAFSGTLLRHFATIATTSTSPNSSLSSSPSSPSSPPSESIGRSSVDSLGSYEAGSSSPPLPSRLVSSSKTRSSIRLDIIEDMGVSEDSEDEYDSLKITER